MQVTYLDHMGSDLTVVNCARASYGASASEITDKERSLILYLARGYTSGDWSGLHEKIKYAVLEGDDELLHDLLWQVKNVATHWAPFSHPQISFRVTAPLYIARQLWKSHIGAVGGDCGYAAWSECFDDKTEVLTADGWKLWKDVTDIDELAAPTVDGNFSFEKPLRLISSHYKGEMYNFTSRDLDLCVTPSHDVLVSYELDGRGGNWSEFKKYKATDIYKLRHPKTPRLPTIDLPKGSKKDYWIGKVHGAFLGDGSLSRDGRRVYFHVKKPRKVEMFKELMRKTEFLNWTISPQDDGYTYFRLMTQGFNDLFVGGVSTKSINFSRIKTLSYLQGVMDGLVATDGHVNSKNCTSFSTTSANLHSDLVKLCYLLGRELSTTNIRVDPRWNDAYKVIFKLGRHKFIRDISQVDYDGMVYCAETSTGLLYVRRNGKAAVTGNSSRRYVDSAPNYYIPTIWRGKATSNKQGSSGEVDYGSSKLTALLDQSTEVYLDMLAHNVAPEQARGVLTNSLEVTWTWTGSLAFFYRVFGLRSDSHAQAENQEIVIPFDAKLSELFPVSWQALRFGRL